MDINDGEILSTITRFSDDIKKQKCMAFYEELEKGLKGLYESMDSCNQDVTRYLVPIGTKEEVTYHSKPVNSFRISDHWNWHANKKKCDIDGYIQCHSVDMPKARPENEDGRATKPRTGWQVCLCDSDGYYHCVYGESYSRKNREWKWNENSVDKVIEFIERRSIHATDY